MRSARWLLVPMLSLAACTQERRAGLAEAGGSARPNATSRATSPAPSSAAPSVSSSTSDVERSLDLMHRTASVVVTSSHADGNSTGAYLVDQLPETSWKPNPPDPAPWIEIDLPAPATVERIEVVVALGASATTTLLNSAQLFVPGAGQGWLPHPSRRSIGAGGELLLEPELRAQLTRLRLSLKGAPRGLRVAELRAIGSITRSEVLEPALPETHVQGNPRTDYASATWILGAPYANEDALCQAFTRLPGVDPEGTQPRGELCHALPDVAVAGTFPPEIRAVQRYLLTVPDQVSPWETTALVVRTERGLYPANLALDDNGNEGMCPGGPEGDTGIGNFRFEHGVLLIDRTRYFTPGVLMMDTPNVAPAVAAASVLRCRFEDRLSCREFITRFGAPDLLMTDDGPPYRVKLPETWDWTRTVIVSRRGSVRLTPCRAADGERIVPCATPGADIL